MLEVRGKRLEVGAVRDEVEPRIPRGTLNGKRFNLIIIIVLVIGMDLLQPD
jgi:hypothetical protein